jgi:predicted metalloprotease with PDZ domain
MNKCLYCFAYPRKFRVYLFLLWIVFLPFPGTIAYSQTSLPRLHYELSIPHPENHSYAVSLAISEWKEDTLCLKLPNWMPGYYQMMGYSKDLEDISARDLQGTYLSMDRLNENTWKIGGIRNKEFLVNYTIRTHRQFVANSYVDADHAYLVPGNTFLYVDGLLQVPVTVKINANPEWDVATGLDPVPGKPDEFSAPDFDRLYDCPILAGDLEDLPPFRVQGIEHRFIGYNMGEFDRELFMQNMRKVVEAATDIMGDIPYKQYTFLGIGPGRGGIEHLNNTTVSFSGRGLDTPQGMERMLSFLAHEYFHHYNVKRIRPFELGPFDYDQGNRTNLLWVSEGLTVYYETRILKRAGLIDEQAMFSQLAESMNTYEADSGKFFQSLSQASYNTWEEGPFGGAGRGPDKSISVYTKGAVVGMLLDIEIRFASGNLNSLDDVMRSLYQEYYVQKKRGFTDAEFQEACEKAAGVSLSALFEYVYTTREIDYDKYLGHMGLKIETIPGETNPETQQMVLRRLEKADPHQSALLSAWLEE